MGDGDEDVGEDDGGVGVDRRHTMMALTVFRCHRERGGESPPSSSSSLTFSLDGRRVSPLVLGPMAWEGREPLQDWICLSVSLCFCVPYSALSPFLIFPEIRNSDWAEIWTQFLSG